MRAARSSIALILGCVVGGLTGCTSRQENTWLFAAAEVPRPPLGASTEEKPEDVRLKFYRVKISGTSVNADAKLLDGMYPAGPLHELFGEIKDPNPSSKSKEGGQTTPGNGDHADHASADADTTPGVPTTEAAVDADVRNRVRKAMDVECAEDGSLQIMSADERFTIFYGTNADAMAEQVANFAKAETLGQGLARLLLATSGAGETQVEAKKAKEDAEALKKSATAVAKVLKETKFETTTTRADARKSFVASANKALEVLGSSTKLDDKSEDWTKQATATVNAIRDQKGK